MSDAAQDPPSDIAQALALFRAQFAQSLPGRMAQTREALQACRAAPQDDEALRTFHRVLHRLAGSAGTFGFPDYGDACRAIEMRLEALLEQPVRSAGDFDAVAAALDALPPP